MLGQLTPFAAALCDALVSAGWDWYPVALCWRHHESDCEVTLCGVQRVKASVPNRGCKIVSSRLKDPAAAAHAVAEGVLAFVRYATTT